MSTVAANQVLTKEWTQFLAHWEAAFPAEVTPEAAQTLVTRMIELVSTLCRQQFQQWLQRAECSAKTIGRGGVLHRFKKVSDRTFLTPMGPITVARRLYQPDAGGAVHVPLDAAWGMAGQYAMPAVREAVTMMLGQMPADDAAAVLGKVAWFRIGVTQMKTLAAEFGDWLEDNPETLDEVRAEEEIPVGTQSLVVSLDGSNVRLNEPGPKPGRPPSGAAGDSEPTCCKNAMVGVVSFYGRVPEGKKTPERLLSRYVAHMPEAGSPTFRLKLQAEVDVTLERIGPDTKRVVVIDGSAALWNHIDTDPTYRDFAKILDYYHAAEHLAAAAIALFGKGTPAANAWRDKYRGKLIESNDGGHRILRAIDHALRTRKLSAAARKAAAKERRFFLNNHRRMRYAEFRKQGLPIGSGPVEAAGKTLVKQRLGLSGMFWSRTGGQHILNIRTLIKSGRWEKVWPKFAETALAA